MRISDYAQYNTLTMGKEVIHGALWDTLQYTSGTTVFLNFFQQTLAANSPDVTNMMQPGQLSYPNQFLVRAIRFWVKQLPESVNVVAPPAIQTGASNNIHLLVNTGLLVITHGNKEYGRYPLRDITAGNGIFGNLKVANILVAGAFADYAQNGYPHCQDTFVLAKPLLIETSQNFVYQLSWPAAVTLTRNTNLCLLLEGDLIRAIQ